MIGQHGSLKLYLSVFYVYAEISLISSITAPRVHLIALKYGRF